MALAKDKDRDLAVKIIVAFDLLVCARRHGQAKRMEEHLRELNSLGVDVQFRDVPKRRRSVKKTGAVR